MQTRAYTRAFHDTNSVFKNPNRAAGLKEQMSLGTLMEKEKVRKN